MNFCAAILILKMKEDTQHFWCITLYYMKEGKNTTEMPKKKKKRFVQCIGEGAMTDQMCQKWFVKFLGAFDIWPNNSLPWGCLAPPASTH